MERRFIAVEKGLGPQGRVTVVRFDRGDNINALSGQAMRELRDVTRDFEDDLETSVVILTGSAKAFSAGADLKDPEGWQRQSLSVGERIHRQRLGPKMCKAWQDMDQVTIAAKSGVMHDAKDGEKLFGSPAIPDRQAKRQIIAMHQLPDLIRRVRELEKKLGMSGAGGEKE